MKKVKSKRCKSKGCNNLVLRGKHCEYCTKKRKEIKEKAEAGFVGVVLLGCGAAIKKGVLKQVPIIAAKVAKLIVKS